MKSFRDNYDFGKDLSAYQDALKASGRSLVLKVETAFVKSYIPILVGVDVIGHLCDTSLLSSFFCVSN